MAAAVAFLSRAADLFSFHLTLRRQFVLRRWRSVRTNGMFRLSDACFEGHRIASHLDPGAGIRGFQQRGTNRSSTHAETSFLVFICETVRSSTGFFAVEIIFETSTRFAYRPKQLGAVDESQGGGRISQVG